MAHHHTGPAEQGHAAHGHDLHTPGADKMPAFAGLVVGGIALFAIMWGVVHLTNQKFEGHGEGGAKPAANGAPAGH